ncbi:MAG: hypothetical protein FJ279_01345 [Planctomycetes bacterium]|nr:hypothetical protein [Planctomycetota bacterium]
MTRVDVTIRTEDYVHYRPATIIKRICDLFPDTAFSIERAPSVQESLRTIDPRQFLALATACLSAGENVRVVATGPSEDLAAAFLKAILENLNIVYTNTKSQSPRSMKDDIADLLSRTASDHPDPLRHAVMRLVDEKIRERIRPPVRSYSPPSYTVQTPATASMHGAVVTALTRVARYHACALVLHYEHPTAGLLTFDVSSDDEWVVMDFLAFTPPRGTLITAEAFGEQCKVACDLVLGMLKNLAYVDAWIRTCILQKKTDAEVVEGIARIIARAKAEPSPVVASDEVRDYKLNDLLLRELIVVNPRPTAKEAALDELVAVLSRHAAMSSTDLRGLVGLWSDKVNVCSDGFAYVHARAKDCPLIMLAVGVYADGIAWPTQQDRKNVVALIVAAIDAPNTYMGYVGRLLTIFRHNRPLVLTLTEAQTSAEVIKLLKEADARAQSTRECRRQEDQQRLLLVESLEDDITVGRHVILAASPRMRDFRIDYIYAIGEDAKNTSSLDKPEFAERLRSRIAEFMPHYVLFHTGHIFQEHISWFEDVVRELRRRFPHVRFGYQQKTVMRVSDNLFTDDEDTRRTQSLVFKEVLGI